MSRLLALTPRGFERRAQAPAISHAPMSGVFLTSSPSGACGSDGSNPRTRFPEHFSGQVVFSAQMCLFTNRKIKVSFLQKTRKGVGFPKYSRLKRLQKGSLQKFFTEAPPVPFFFF